ncbi:hypothetical protein L210DRAFT_3766081 [Boletus edulis BED1]|uniref:Uncharacterized protein n=1 Tax=Boletus edulis BED1 TaxID=1328754 RepID=A0AAD4G744_BOLED|nr:hypothetical protein L210DRAFT_3766081 [Boletus edulis BED1]
MASLCRRASTHLSNTILRQSVRSPLLRCRHTGLPHARSLSLLSNVKGAFKTPESEILDKITAVPFYELSHLPPPIQLNWLFLFLDAVFTGTGVALAWRYWSYQVPGDEEGTPPKEELRPVNHRLALACFHLGVGSVVALRLINVRRSHVRKLWLFPGSVPGSYRRAKVLPSLDTIVVENYSLFNPRVEFTLERNAYRFSGHKQDAILRLTPPGGREDGFVLLTKGVQIDGKPVSRDEALREILDPFQQFKATNSNTSTKTKAHSKKKKHSSIPTAAS